MEGFLYLAHPKELKILFFQWQVGNLLLSLQLNVKTVWASVRELKSELTDTSLPEVTRTTILKLKNEINNLT
jgi:hypothetical protein